MEKRDVIRRTLAGAAIATLAALPFAGAASAQNTDTDTDTDGGGGSTTTTQVVNTTARPSTTLGGTGLARTGGDWTLPATVAGAGVAVAVGARRLSRRPAL